MNISSYKAGATHSIAAIALYSAFVLNSTHATAQMPSPSSQPTQSQTQPDAAAQTTDMQDQITQLKQQVAQLQAALQQSKAKKPSSSKSAMSAGKPAMEMEDDSTEMGGMPSGAEKPPMGPMKGKMGGMAAMQGGSTAPKEAPGCCGMSMGKPMGSKAGGMSMDKMPMKSGSTASKMPSAASGEPPHLLHIGAKDFFLDHAQHIGLTPDQKTSLEKFKSDAMQQKAVSQKQLDVAEQELWQLTSADQPNTAEIDKKVQDIAKMRADQQMTFIHAVSAASDVLTPEQRAEAVKTANPANGAKSSMPKQPMNGPMKMQ